jgi:hypothetical protein
MVRCRFGTIYFIWNKLRCGHLGLYSAVCNIRDASYCTNFKMTNPQQIQTNGWRKWKKFNLDGWLHVGMRKLLNRIRKQPTNHGAPTYVLLSCAKAVPRSISGG